jgi:hypothetical protein
VAVLLGVVVVALLGLAAPAFAGGSTDEQGQEHGRDDRPPELVDDVRDNLDRALPGRGDDGPAAPAEQPAAPLGGAEAPAARTAAPATGPAVTEVAEVPSALATAVVDLPVVDLPVADLPVVAPSAAVPAAAPPSAAAPALPSPAPVPDELLAGAPPLVPLAAAIAQSVGAASAPVALFSPPASVPDAVPPPQIDEAPPPAPPVGDVGGVEQRAAPTGTVAERSFTALLVLIAAVLLFLAVQGRIDRRDPRRADGPGDFCRFR